MAGRHMLPVTVVAVVVAVTLVTLFAATTTALADKRPNIVFIMADDLNFDYKQDRQQIMPALKKYFADQGLYFHNHVAAAPVCGPSRSSLLAGRYPHNTGYVANGAKASIEAWSRAQNNSVGAWLTKAGYYTAFLGKYVNGMECDIVSGFRHWGGLTCTSIPTSHGNEPAGGTYNFYNASQWDVEFDETGHAVVGHVKYRQWLGVHQSEFLANQTVEQARIAVKEDRPFFIHTTPVMVHWGTCYGPQPEEDYAPDDPHWEWNLFDPDKDSHGKVKGKRSVPTSPCPTVQNKHRFDGYTNPHVVSWNKSETGTVPDWIARIGNMDRNGCCDDFDVERQNIGFRNRSASCVDLDQLLGHVVEGLQELGVLENTYIIFSSDNGYHLGEHHLLFGKSEPYDTDIRLPLYIRGPGVPQGQRRGHPTNHLDITATIADLAGATQYAPADLDGQSFKQLLTSDPPSIGQWRNYSFSEFYVQQNTWHAIRYVNESSQEAEFKMSFWCTNQSEVFRLSDDPYETKNLAGDNPTDYGRSVVDQWLPIALAMGKCSGSSCHRPQPSRVGPHPLPCHHTGGLHEKVEGTPEHYLDP